MIEHVTTRPKRATVELGSSISLALGASYLLTRYPLVAQAVLAAGVAFLLNALALLLLVALAIQVARPPDWRAYLALRAFDWRGVVYGFVLLGMLRAAEKLWLEGFVFATVRMLLASLGLTQSASFYETSQLPLAILLLPAAEELFVRGYVQNRLQDLLGPNNALAATTVIWSLWHFWAPQEFIHRLLAGLCVEGLLFWWRRNTWPSLVVHTSRVVVRAVVW